MDLVSKHLPSGRPEDHAPFRENQPSRGLPGRVNAIIRSRAGSLTIFVAEPAK
jgi:hypothetical protein